MNSAGWLVIGTVVVIIGIYTLTSGGNEVAISTPTESRSAPIARPLESQMRINGTKCTLDEATGRVTNNSKMTVKLFIEVQFLDSSGVVVDDSNASVRGLRPGETGEWDAPYLGSRSYSNCRAQVTSAFEH
ncbi:MAG: hypothetical protein IIC82_06430 [Chloroflexi bacterium]|nr:hypothetical protein [Chloroflexota bacterium]